jgi:uncharacterized RDD family membrane protein YckC
MDHDGQVNPYAPPARDALAADVPLTTSGGQLASRGARFGAALIDTFLTLAVLAPMQYAAGVYDNFPKIRPQSFLELLGWSAAGYAFWLAVHSSSIRKGSQTLGKRLLGLQIVNAADNTPASYRTIVLIRFLPIQLVVLLPYVGSYVALLDALFIFRKDHRCIHDHVAGTRVIVKPPR